MCIRAYLLLQTDVEKSRHLISDLCAKPGVVTVDLLEGSPNLIIVIEAAKRQELVEFIVPVLDSVDSMTEDLIPGIFAAGDVTNVPEKQVIIAAGEGAKAALQANRYLQSLTI